MPRIKSRSCWELVVRAHLYLLSGCATRPRSRSLQIDIGHEMLRQTLSHVLAIRTVAWYILRGLFRRGGHRDRRIHQRGQ